MFTIKKYCFNDTTDVICINLYVQKVIRSDVIRSVILYARTLYVRYRYTFRFIRSDVIRSDVIRSVFIRSDVIRSDVIRSVIIRSVGESATAPLSPLFQSSLRGEAGKSQILKEQSTEQPGSPLVKVSGLSVKSLQPRHFLGSASRKPCCSRNPAASCNIIVILSNKQKRQLARVCRGTPRRRAGRGSVLIHSSLPVSHAVSAVDHVDREESNIGP
jgi:hypothetical protein